MVEKEQSCQTTNLVVMKEDGEWGTQEGKQNLGEDPKNQL